MGETQLEPRRSSSRIGEFLIKTCIVAIAISACTIYVTNWIVESLEESAARTVANLRTELLQTKIGGSEFWAHFETQIDQAADPGSELPPEKKQKLINDVRVIVARWRPFIDAVQSEMEKPRNGN